MASRGKKKQRNSAREYTALEHLVAIFTMFLAKVLMQIKARSRLCLRNVLCFPVITLHKNLRHTHCFSAQFVQGYKKSDFHDFVNHHNQITAWEIIKTLPVWLCTLHSKRFADVLGHLNDLPFCSNCYVTDSLQALHSLSRFWQDRLECTLILLFKVSLELISFRKKKQGIHSCVTTTLYTKHILGIWSYSNGFEFL